ncbi:hypothetical protein [Pontibacter oryzae]|uniref:Uncharacterized protein n=1 Tax=Pontibacter oryzae TaxID=2304593 RepID=A0A399RUF1_9BACT|nr:hypothetical protein [Pontibacter oryzae]RIJ33517.1 hypothetical protein D1627_18055 [Pontibacter oryzae]
MPHAKYIWSISLAILVMVNVLSMPLIRLGYELNKEYIIQNLCVNRDKPQLQCEGKCHLSKSVKAANQESQDQTNFKAKSLSYDFISVTEAATPVAKVWLPARTYGYYSLSAYNAYSSKILHPPQV